MSYCFLAPGVSSWMSVLSILVWLACGSSLTWPPRIADMAIASCLVIALCLWILLDVAELHVSAWLSSKGLAQSGQWAASGGGCKKRRPKPDEISQSVKVVNFDVGRELSQWCPK
jgi:hypothetical protein